MSNNTPPCGWPQMLKLFVEASAALIRQAQASEFNEHSYEQLLAATQRVVDYGQQGLSALATQPAPQPEAQALPASRAAEKSLLLKIKEYGRLSDQVGRSRQSNNYAMNKGAVEKLVDLEMQIEAELTSPAPAPLSNEQIEQGRRDTFSTDNPFCPCDSKTMRKAVRWAEWAHKIGLDGGM